jgi:hypothetical protein
VWSVPAVEPIEGHVGQKVNKGCTVSPTIYNGNVYVISRGPDRPPKGGPVKSCWITVYDLATGEKKQQIAIPHPHGTVFIGKGEDAATHEGKLSGGTDGASSSFAFNNRLCLRAHGKDSGGRLGVWRIGDDGRLSLQECWRPQSFDVAHTPCVVDGRIYLRGAARMYCYDLREQHGEGDQKAGRE